MGSPEAGDFRGYEADLLAALVGGGLDAVGDDAPIAAHFARRIPGMRVVGTLPDTDAHYAILVRKGERTAGRGTQRRDRCIAAGWHARNPADELGARLAIQLLVLEDHDQAA